MMRSDYKTLLAAWGLEFAGLAESRPIEGSPERVASRTVVFDSANACWIIEKIAAETLARKREIAAQLQQLSDRGLTQVHPYCKTLSGAFLVESDSEYWMLRPYIEGVPLNRETYLQDEWRVDVLADFLIQFRNESRSLQGSYFSIAAYAEDRCSVWRGRYPRLVQRLMPSFTKLQREFFSVHDQLPRALCHGDYHPLNVVWGRQCIESVIDWEFCGVKPELYDVALLLGCFGFDDPDNLLKAPAVRLLERLRSADFAANVSWEYVLDLMAAIRFGWMSEWIRRGDQEALEMECLYIDILVDQKEYIQSRWF